MSLLPPHRLLESLEGRVLEIILSSCHHHPTNHASAFERKEGMVQGTFSLGAGRQDLCISRAATLVTTALCAESFATKTDEEVYYWSYELLDKEIKPVESVSNGF